MTAATVTARGAFKLPSVIYVLRAMVGASIPLNSGCLVPVTINIPENTILSPGPDRAVAGGNVETSQRVVEVILGALGRSAASQGTMNNLAMGSRRAGRSWDYYETIGGGTGAGCRFGGLNATQSHMTNTLNTPIEVLEMNFPLRLLQYRLRDGSGGSGQHRGGDGLVREYEFLEPATVTLLTERRTHRPWGLDGGAAGAAGENRKTGGVLPAKTSFEINAGERLRISTPGGGGWGSVIPDV